MTAETALFGSHFQKRVSMVGVRGLPTHVYFQTCLLRKKTAPFSKMLEPFWLHFFFSVAYGLPVNAALLGGSMLPVPFDILPRSPCSLQFFGACSFYQFSLLLFHLTLLPAPFLIFPLAP